MGFVDAVKTVYTNYVKFEGRSGRAEFWWYILFYVIVYVVLAAVSDLLASLFALGSLLPSLGVSVRRLHDTGHSGWWVLLSLIPLIGFIILIIMSYARASAGPNEHGQPAESGGGTPPPPSSDETVV